MNTWDKIKSQIQKKHGPLKEYGIVEMKKCQELKEKIRQ